MKIKTSLKVGKLAGNENPPADRFVGRRLHKRATISALAILAVALVMSTARAQAVAKDPSVAKGPSAGKGPYYPLPSWDQTLPSNARFIVLSNFDNAAVLDLETGLVWERSPDQTLVRWGGAQRACRGKVVGKRFGWRLPAIQELLSLMDGDPANTDEPRLPPGHPFIDVGSIFYWSGSNEAREDGITDVAYALRFTASPFGIFNKSVNEVPAWCVRGGAGIDPQ